MGRMLKVLPYMCLEVWRNIGVAQKVSLVLIALGGVVAAIAVVYAGTRPNWQVLYTGLDRETSAKIYELAKDERVPVKLQDSGRTILVPFKDVYSLRLKVASEEIAVDRKAVGLELFDNVKFGLTERQQEVGYQRALQGELQRMICEMPEVADAKVMLAIPRKRVLKSHDNIYPSASVMVVLKPGRTLDARRVGSIRYLVASAVENMSSHDVTVVDSEGILLAKQRPVDEASEGDSDKMMEVKRRVEADLREKAEAILRPIVGQQSVVAVVSVDLDMSRVDKVVENYDAENAIAISDRQVSEEKGKEHSGSSGVAGAGSNLVAVNNPEGATTTGKGTQEMRKTLESEYVVPKTTERTSTRGPRIKQLSVAVSIARKSDTEARATEILESYKRLVVSAVGASTDPKVGRGDLVEVVETEFLEPVVAGPHRLPPPGVPVLQKITDQLRSLLPSSFARPLLAIVLLALLYRMFNRTLRREDVEGFDVIGTALGPAARPYGELPADKEAEVVTAEKEGSETSDESPFEVVSREAEMAPERLASALEAWLRHDV